MCSRSSKDHIFQSFQGFYGWLRPMAICFYCLLLSGISLDAQAQETGKSAFHRCVSQSMHEQYKGGLQLNKANVYTVSSLSEGLAGQDSCFSEIVIPVVVHILHNQADGNITGNNISAEQVSSQIDRLNADYSALNMDLSPIAYPFRESTLTNSTGLRFHLASVDPLGNATDGITRTYTDSTSFSRFTNSIKSEETGGTSPWPTCLYLNIWVAPSLDEGSILGYAQFPDGDPATDGVVVAHPFFGDDTGTAIPTIAGPYYKGRTAVHEIGHYFNLLHPFTAGCADGDGLADTPPQQSPSFNCPIAKFTCSSFDDSSNFMDFSTDDCLRHFSREQALRMRETFNLNPDRVCLLDAAAWSCPEVLADPVAPILEIALEDTLLCSGEQLMAIAQSNRCIESLNWTLSGALLSEPEEASTYFQFEDTAISGAYALTVNAVIDGELLSTSKTVYLQEEDLCASDEDLSPPCLVFDPATVELLELPCGFDCSEALIPSTAITPYTTFQLPDLTAGASYTFEFCESAATTAWQPHTYLYAFEESSGTLSELIAAFSDCSFSITIPDDGSYLISFSPHPNCPQPDAGMEALDPIDWSITCAGEIGETCVCDVWIAATEADVEFCEGDDDVLLSVMGDPSDHYSIPEVFWMAAFEAGPDGELLTPDDVFTGEDLPPIENGAFVEGMRVIGFGADFLYEPPPPVACDTVDIYLKAIYGGLVPVSGGGVNLELDTELCTPYPYASVRLRVFPDAMGYNLNLSNCPPIVEPICEAQQIQTLYAAEGDGTTPDTLVIQELACLPQAPDTLLLDPDPSCTFCALLTAMATDTLFVCMVDSISSTPDCLPYSGEENVRGFVLHTLAGTDIGTVLYSSMEAVLPPAEEISGLESDVTYYFSLLIAPPNEFGEPDWTHPDAQLSIGRPIVFVEPYNYDFTISELCDLEAELYLVNIAISEGPFSIQEEEIYSLSGSINAQLEQGQDTLISIPLAEADGQFLLEIQHPDCGIKTLVDQAVICSSMPIELHEFNATTTATHDQLSWALFTDNPIDHFELMIADEQGAFKLISQIEVEDSEQGGFITKTYAQPWNGATQNYYQLRAIGMDGTILLTASVSVQRAATEASAPAYVYYDSSSNSWQLFATERIAAYQIFDVQGRLVQQETQLNTLSLVPLALNTAHRGMFLLKVHFQNGETKVLKVIVP